VGGWEVAGDTVRHVAHSWQKSWEHVLFDRPPVIDGTPSAALVARR